MVDMVPRQDRADLSAQAPWPLNPREESEGTRVEVPQQIGFQRDHLFQGLVRLSLASFCFTPGCGKLIQILHSDHSVISCLKPRILFLFTHE